MEQTPALVSVRFLSCRSTLTGCHYAGVVYEVPDQFARQVVEQERVAEYLDVPTPMEKPKKPGARRAA